MLPLLAVVLMTTPVALSVELSGPTQERVGTRLIDALRQRLAEDGFSIEPSSSIRLVVEELHGTLKLSASVDGQPALSSEVKPTGSEWKDELTLEIAQRLVVLAHEAASRKQPPVPIAHLPAPSTPSPLASPEPEPEPTPIVIVDTPNRFHVAIGLRAGIAARFPSIDPAFGAHLALIGAALEPLVSAGVVIATEPALTAVEVPLGVGARLPFRLPAELTLSPEALVGLRVHAYSASSVDPGGARVDVLGALAVNLVRRFGPFRFGLRVALELSAAREHRGVQATWWARGPASLNLQAIGELP